MSASPARSLPSPLSKAAVISHDGGVIGCKVAEISIVGARLLVARAAIVPDQFELQTSLSGGLRRCRTVWRDDGLVEVEFIA